MVTYVDKLADGENTRYLFQVNAPFEDTPDAANAYAATFDFDAEGNFIDVYLQINILRDDAYTLRESVVFLDRQTVAETILAEFDRATNTSVAAIGGAEGPESVF